MPAVLRLNGAAYSTGARDIAGSALVLRHDSVEAAGAVLWTGAACDATGIDAEAASAVSFAVSSATPRRRAAV